MRAVCLHAYSEPLRLEDVPEPTITGPHDVIVRVGGAGVCRTDVHIRDGWFAPAVPTELPMTLGHENTGWVHEVGSAVENVGAGDAVICHPQLSCGLCPACRTGDDMRCARGLAFTGLTRDGGFAELLKTTDRGVLRLCRTASTFAVQTDGADPVPVDLGRRDQFVALDLLRDAFVVPAPGAVVVGTAGPDGAVVGMG